MKHLKVALFTGNYNHIRDGVSLTLNRWVSFLLENNNEVLVFGPTTDVPDLEHVGEFTAVPSISMPGRPEYRITTGFPKSKQKELSRFNPDLIHIATPDILGFKALKWARNAEKPIVSSYHTHFTSYLKYYKLGLLEPLGWMYLRWFYSHCEHVYVPTPSMVDELRGKKIGVGKDSLKIWARGVDTSQFHPAKRDSEWRRSHGFQEKDIVITFVSRLVWEKNLDLFSNVITKLQNKYPHVKTLVVGDGPARKEIEEKLPGTVFTGFLTGDELARSYASSDIFFFPSDTETFGNVTLEAMASGLPCIVADAPGSKSLVRHGVNGFLESVENEEGFFNFAEELVRNDERRKRMANASVKRADEFTWNKVNSGLLECYQKVIENN